MRAIVQKETGESREGIQIPGCLCWLVWGSTGGDLRWVDCWRPVGGVGVRTSRAGARSHTSFKALQGRKLISTKARSYLSLTSLRQVFTSLALMMTSLSTLWLQFIFLNKKHFWLYHRQRKFLKKHGVWTNLAKILR